jgi:TonB family protein
MKLKIFLLLILPTALFAQKNRPLLNTSVDSCSYCKEYSKLYPFSNEKDNEFYKSVCTIIKTINIVDPDNPKISRKVKIFKDKCSNDIMQAFTRSKRGIDIMKYKTTNVKKGVIVDVDSTSISDNETLYTLQIDTLPVNPDNKIILRQTGLVIKKILIELPGFPGGADERYRFLQKNVIYPELAKQNGIEGTVYTSFTVTTDGSITKIKTVKGLGYGLDEEMIRIIKLMPKWNPGKQNGKPGNFEYVMPMKFILSE